ncbi:hypothetical protein VYU27_005601 [Nannochloropsis oceanica]
MPMRLVVYSWLEPCLVCGPILCAGANHLTGQLDELPSRRASFPWLNSCTTPNKVINTFHTGFPCLLRRRAQATRQAAGGQQPQGEERDGFIFLGWRRGRME